MYKNLIPFLKCPQCNKDIHIGNITLEKNNEIIQGTVSCENGHDWFVEEGVLVFTRKDAPSDPWSKTFSEYEKYVEVQKNWIPGNLSQSSEVFYIINELPSNPPDIILDICTGQGALLFNLLKKYDAFVNSIDLMSIDMSMKIQKHNRRYMKENFGDLKVNFISGDVSNLPFKDNKILLVTSFGMGNMLEKMSAGIKEVKRVLQDKGKFVFNHSFVDENSEGWEVLTNELKKRGISGNIEFLGIAKSFVYLMERLGFSDLKIEIVNEVIGDPEKDESGPIFPYPNERLSEVLVEAIK